MQKLKSPNIVSLFDVMETTNNYYIIQEFCDGGDLDEWTIAFFHFLFFYLGLLLKRKYFQNKKLLNF